MTAVAESGKVFDDFAERAKHIAQLSLDFYDEPSVSNKPTHPGIPARQETQKTIDLSFDK